MKKIFSVFLLSSFVFSAANLKAQELELAYDAGAELVSTYLWRGQYNGGLSFQPDLAIGWDSEHTSFRFGTWWSVGASDWGFRKGLPSTDDYNPNTYFVPEVDIYANVSLWGVNLGFTHYYYFDNTNFFAFGPIGKVKDMGHTAQTEVSLGYDFSTLLEIPLYFSWNTMVSGDDGYLTDLSVNSEGELDGKWKRAYSTYIEVGYTHTWEDLGLSLGGALGFSPWKSIYTDMDWIEIDENDNSIIDSSHKFAVNNIMLRLEKEWPLADDLCSISVFGVGMLNTCNLKDNVFVKGSGDDKICVQKLNGAIGMSVWF